MREELAVLKAVKEEFLLVISWVELLLYVKALVKNLRSVSRNVEMVSFDLKSVITQISLLEPKHELSTNKDAIKDIHKYNDIEDHNGITPPIFKIKPGFSC